jgi:hypothetical protein
MPKEDLYLVVGAQKNENRRIAPVKEHSAQFQAKSYLPQFEWVQLPQTQTGMPRAGKSRSEVRERIKDGGPLLGGCASTAAEELFFQDDGHRFS